MTDQADEDPTDPTDGEITPPPPPPPMSQPPPPVPPTADQSQAILSLVLSGLGIVAVCCNGLVPLSGLLGIPLAIAGLVVGTKERNAVRSGIKPASLEGIAKTAVILGWVSLGINAIVVLLIILAVVGMFALGGGVLFDSLR